MDWIIQLGELHEILKSSAFATVVVGAFGAFFGALGAQFAIGRSQRKRELVADLNAVNSALSLCFFTSNTFLAAKKQHIVPMWSAYSSLQNDCKRFVEVRSHNTFVASLPFESFEFLADFKTLLSARVPLEAFEGLVFDKLSIRVRGLAAASELFSAIVGLEKAHLSRNSLIEEFRVQAPIPRKRLAELYFGIRDENGFEDARYSDFMRAITSYTDDCIFFSKILGGELASYGDSLRKNGRKHLFFFLPKAVLFDWSKVEMNQLMPDEEEYAGWLNGFGKRETTVDKVRQYFGCNSGDTG
ncbi:hypothetical protein [Parvibaculum sp. MBR-TMA-1.3b-4.2]|jgi:hypothetical protein